jgi:hypothetical protein
VRCGPWLPPSVPASIPAMGVNWHGPEESDMALHDGNLNGNADFGGQP